MYIQVIQYLVPRILPAFLYSNKSNCMSYSSVFGKRRAYFRNNEEEILGYSCSCLQLQLQLPSESVFISKSYVNLSSNVLLQRDGDFSKILQIVQRSHDPGISENWLLRGKWVSLHQVWNILAMQSCGKRSRAGSSLKILWQKEEYNLYINRLTGSQFKVLIY